MRQKCINIRNQRGVILNELTTQKFKKKRSVKNPTQKVVGNLDEMDKCLENMVLNSPKRNS